MLPPKEVEPEATGRSLRRWTRLDVLAVTGVIAAFLYARVPSMLVDAVRYGWSVVPNVLSFTVAALIARTATLAAGFVLAFVFWSNGRAFARVLKLTPTSRLESAASAFALGSLLWGQLFLALGLVGVLHVPFLLMVLAAGAAVGLWDAVRHPPDVTVARRELHEAGVFWLGALAVHFLILAPYSFIPETFYDSLLYHLGLPGLYLLRGHIGSVPDNAFSGLPALHSMVYGWALAVEPGGRVSHLFNFAFFIATCAAILGLARRFGRPWTGGPAALIFATSPLLCGLSYITGTEMPETFWLTAALAAILNASEARDLTGHWVAAGLMIGAAMSTKNTAWVFPLAAAAAAWAALGRRPPGKTMGWAAVSAAFMLAPWLLKNIFFYGNPIYPFFHEFFSPHADIMPNWHYLVTARTPWDSGVVAGLVAWLKTPLVFLRPSDGDIMQLVNPAILGLLPVGLWQATRCKETQPVVWYAVLCWLPLSMITGLPRYFVPVLPVFSLIAVLALKEAQSVLHGLVFAVALCLAVYVWRRGSAPVKLAVFTGQITDASFIEHADGNYYIAPLAAAAHWLDAKSPKNARVLIFGDARGFHLTRDYLASTPAQMTILERWSNSSADAGALHARFAAESVGYILVNHGEIFQQRHKFSMTTVGKKTLDDFWARYTLKVFQAGPKIAVRSDGSKILDHWVVVYQVLSEEEAAKPHASDDLFAVYTSSTGRH